MSVEKMPTQKDQPVPPKQKLKAILPEEKVLEEYEEMVEGKVVVKERIVHKLPRDPKAPLEAGPQSPQRSGVKTEICPFCSKIEICPFCSKMFKNKKTFKTHRAEKHPQPGDKLLVPCPVCKTGCAANSRMLELQHA